MDAPFVKEELESIRHLQYSNVVNSVGMLRQANIICDRTNDATQAFIIYKNMAIPGILERFYRKMQNRLGIMMTRADVTSISDRGDRVVVSCENTLLGMDFDLDVDHGGSALRHCANHTALDLTINLLPIARARIFPDLTLFDGFADSNYICFPYGETRRTGVYAARLCASANDDGRMHGRCCRRGSQRPSSVLKLETTACVCRPKIWRQVLPHVQFRTLRPVQALHRGMSIWRP